MKDTFLIGTFVAVVVGFWFYLQKTDFGAAPSAVLSASSPATTMGASLPQKSMQPRSEHESRNQNHHSTLARNGETEANAGSVAEAEKLPSISSRKSSDPESKSEFQPESQSPKRVKKGRASRKGKVAHTADNKKNNKYVHGVPVDQWLEWNKNRLRLGEVAAPTEAGLRLFVQCMEMKKGGPQSVAQGDCIKLTARTPKINPSTY